MLALHHPLRLRTDPAFGKACRRSRSTSRSCRSIALLTPIVFHFQGVYRLRRGRSRIDDFFSVLVGSILVVVLGVLATLYFQAYYASDAKQRERRLPGLADRLGAVPRPDRGVHLCVARGGARAARAAMARRRRAEAHSHCRRRRSRPDARRPHAAAPRARLSGRRLH